MAKDSLVVELEAEKDEGTMGLKDGRVHYVFPAGIKDPFERAMEPEITGGVWIKAGVTVPGTITIKLR